MEGEGALPGKEGYNVRWPLDVLLRLFPLSWKVVWRESMFRREKLCEKLMESSGAIFLHPYNDPRVMAGQGTIALELLEQVDLPCIGPLSGIITGHGHHAVPLQTTDPARCRGTAAVGR